MKTRLVLVSGFLGSGKTSFVKHWVENLKPGRDSAALVVNEIGKSGLDAALVSRYGLDVMKLLSGCLCCSAREDLLLNLGRLLAEPKMGKPVDWIVIESSGLADPADTLDALLNPKLAALSTLAAAVTVVDASRYASLSAQNPLLARQAAFASMLVVNKSDLSNPSHRSDLEASLRQSNKTARLAWTTQAALDRKVWKEEMAQPSVLTLPNHETREGNSFEGYYAWEWEAPGKLDREKLAAFLSSLPTWVERVKGVVQMKDSSWVLVQVAGNQNKLHPWHEEPSLKPGLSFIGRGLSTQHSALIPALEACL